jgi:serine/threonine protein kinase
LKTQSIGKSPVVIISSPSRYLYFSSLAPRFHIFLPCIGGFALLQYKNSRENGEDQDSLKNAFPSADFENLKIDDSTYYKPDGPNGENYWPDASGRYWWRLTLADYTITEDFYWTKDESAGRGWPDKNDSDRYWFIVHNRNGAKIEGFSWEADRKKGFPDKDGNYWRYVQYTESGAIKAWMEEKDLRYLARIGDAQTKLKLAQRYHEGDKEAIDWFHEAAELGHEGALNQLQDFVKERNRDAICALECTAAKNGPNQYKAQNYIDSAPGRYSFDPQRCSPQGDDCVASPSLGFILVTTFGVIGLITLICWWYKTPKSSEPQVRNISEEDIQKAIEEGNFDILNAVFIEDAEKDIKAWSLVGLDCRKIHLKTHGLRKQGTIISIIELFETSQQCLQDYQKNPDANRLYIKRLHWGVARLLKQQKQFLSPKDLQKWLEIWSALEKIVTGKVAEVETTTPDSPIVTFDTLTSGSGYIPIANEDTRKRIWHRAIRAAHEPPLQRSEARFVGATRESPFHNSPVEYDISLNTNRILKCNGYIFDSVDEDKTTTTPSQPKTPDIESQTPATIATGEGYRSNSKSYKLTPPSPCANTSLSAQKEEEIDPAIVPPKKPGRRNRAFNVVHVQPDDKQTSPVHLSSHSSNTSDEYTPSPSAKERKHKQRKKFELDKKLIIDYQEIRLDTALGQGGFGTVHKGTWIDTKVAVKILLQIRLDDRLEQSFKEEVAVMCDLRHKHIVQLYGVVLSPKYCIVMEFMAKGSLHQVLHSTEPLSWRLRYKIGLDISKGLSYLHSRHKPILHRDLKSANVLLDKHYQAKLSDFGLAKIKASASLSRPAGAAGTLPWMAPELLLDPTTDLTTACDIYSLAMLFWELASRKTPYLSLASPGLIFVYVGHNAKREIIPSNTPRIFYETITACWEQDPKARPSASQVIALLKTARIIDDTPQPSPHRNFSEIFSSSSSSSDSSSESETEEALGIFPSSSSKTRSEEYQRESHEPIESAFQAQSRSSDFQSSVSANPAGFFASPSSSKFTTPASPESKVTDNALIEEQTSSYGYTYNTNS